MTADVEQNRNTGKIIYRCNLESPDKYEIEEDTRLKSYLKWQAEKEEELKVKKELKKLNDELQKLEYDRACEEKKKKETLNQAEFKLWQENKNKELRAKRAKEKTLSAMLENATIQKKKRDEKSEKEFEQWLQIKERLKKTEQERRIAENMRKKVENEARKAKSEIIYNNWKEKALRRQIEIPKNGFQIFGPKPKPVVAQEWIFDRVMEETESLTSLRSLKTGEIGDFSSETLFRFGCNNSRSSLTSSNGVPKVLGYIFVIIIIIIMSSSIKQGS